MVLRLRNDNHNCWGNCESNAQEMETAIEQWKSLMETKTVYQSTGIVTSQSDFVGNLLNSNGASQSYTINLANGSIQSPFVYEQGYLWAPAGAGNNFDANSTSAISN